MQRWHVFLGLFFITAFVTVLLAAFFDVGTFEMCTLLACTGSAAAMALTEYQKRAQ